MILISLLIFLQWNGNSVHSRDTNCDESQKLFADLCFSPTPTDQFDPEWVRNNQPDDGWHTDIGNDVLRLHMAELLKGQILKSVDEDIEKNICFRVKLEHGEQSGYQDGRLFGLGDSTSNFTCTASKDFFGVEKCKIDSSISEYHEDMNLYFSYFDKKNVMVAILCFPTGQVGWHSMSVNNKLTEEEKLQVNQHVASLGFPDSTTVEIYNNENCIKKS